MVYPVFGFLLQMYYNRVDIEFLPQVFGKVRGSGLLIGLPVAEPFKGRAKDITKACEAIGLMLLIAGPDVVRLAPALIVTDAQIDEADRIMRAAVAGMLETAPAK